LIGAWIKEPTPAEESGIVPYIYVSTTSRAWWPTRWSVAVA